MKLEERRELALLEAVERDEQITQRSLASALGIALGLANLYLKRLVRKGYIKCVNVRSNRLLYLITPTGLVEKTRLTYEFIDYSLDLYRGVRQNLKTVLEPLVQAGLTNIAIHGTGEAAELAYLSLREQGIEAAAIFDVRPGGRFLGMIVQSISDLDVKNYDRIIVASLDNGEAIRDELVRRGVDRDSILLIRDRLGNSVSTSNEGRARVRKHT
ncbi:MAG: winged helix-turn-helix transcriptional regulator [Acidobacteriota bacterium]|nr:winged helix-turn-helix transcriptional regulator [Acidobacteriota bacterium]|tara:strand:+ start:177 stop:818 length:642 start_codon:yes stop_codon:yes gene_type:complete